MDVLIRRIRLGFYPFFRDIISLSISLFLKGYSIISSIQEILGIYLLSLSLSYILKPDIYLAKDRSPVILKCSLWGGFCKETEKKYLNIKNIVFFCTCSSPATIRLRNMIFLRVLGQIFFPNILKRTKKPIEMDIGYIWWSNPKYPYHISDF